MQKYALILMFIILSGCVSKSVLTLDDMSDENTKAFKYKFEGTPSQFVKEISLIFSKVTGYSSVQTRSTATTKSYLFGQEVSSSCEFDFCIIGLSFINGERTNSAGKIVSEQNINILMKLKRSGEYLSGEVVIPNQFDIIERRNLLGSKQDLLLSEFELKVVLDRLKSVMLPSEIRDVAMQNRIIRNEMKSRFIKYSKVKKEVGMLVCSADNRLGYIEKVSGERIKVDVKGYIPRQDFYYLFLNKDRNFSYKKVGGNLQWYNSEEWANCEGFTSIN